MDLLLFISWTLFVLPFPMPGKRNIKLLSSNKKSSTNEEAILSVLQRGHWLFPRYYVHIHSTCVFLRDLPRGGNAAATRHQRHYKHTL
ncbi:hypothetical protein ElyMa_005303800 [Elysia marginata]|uniref:Secreted protein n=1 Tax=Elysia marginata TaxID=1093978 RepID=A0AAV4JYA2_9GAST|nr:hypothetical protein ElyMa_005303800 [Elysia marginata]